MDTQQNQLVERLKTANNILVAVNSDPTVDQLAGAIGLTLILNKLGKHGTAVFSGKTPSTIEFLQPEKTLEKTTDSLQDFIIALDKAKADKLRYKVDGELVKIFITPYRTALKDSDLEFTQGDFNVEVVLALGVNEQKDLDQAIISHGRILHDATVVGINARSPSTFGSINWVSDTASSVSEMIAELGGLLKEDIFDAQIATALMTGIVAETDRFGNEKTTAATMKLIAKLMDAGANQQLVTTQLETPPEPEPDELPQPDTDADASANSDIAAIIGNSDTAGLTEETPKETPKEPAKPKAPSDGSLEIDHSEKPAYEPPAEDMTDQIHISDAGELKKYEELAKTGQLADEAATTTAASTSNKPHIILQPPTTPITDPSSHEDGADSAENVLVGAPPASDIPILGRHNDDSTESKSSEAVPAVDTPTEQVPEPTLPSIVDSPIASPATAPSQQGPSNIDAVRDAVNDATKDSTDSFVKPIAALNAQPMDLNLGPTPANSTVSAADFDRPQTPLPDDGTGNTQSGLNLVDPGPPADATATAVGNPTAPPPVPPPMMPPM